MVSSNSISLNGNDAKISIVESGITIMTIDTNGIAGSVFSDINANSAPNTLATVGYVNNVVSGLAVKDPCKVITSGDELTTGANLW